jgi:hypothetical protein
LQVSNVLARNWRTAGVQDAPKSFIGSIMWNVEISYLRLNTQAGETVRHTVGGVSVRCGKKRMPACNGLDTGSKFARLERVQTSRGCPITRNPEELHQERKANDGWPSGTLVHFSPKGIVAVSQYRKAGVYFIPAGGPIRAHFWEA